MGTLEYLESPAPLLDDLGPPPDPDPRLGATPTMARPMMITGPGPVEARTMPAGVDRTAVEANTAMAVE